jgi:transcriptional regulator with XRE-family HTH domain
VIFLGISRLNNKLNIVGKNIRKYRELKGLSQNDVCCQIALLGITLYKSDIYNIEKGERILKDFELFAFSKIFKITLDELFKNIDTDFLYVCI